MCSGYDRYFQIARCFRDEDLRADRQPEFTQVDMELSFVDVDDVIAVNEKLLKYICKEAIGLEVELPIQRMTWQEAMDRFGSDKPDTRFGMELTDVSSVVAGCGFGVFTSALENGGSVRGINAKGQAEMPRKKIDALVDFAKGYGARGLAYLCVLPDGSYKSSFAKFMTEDQLKALVEAMSGEPGDLLLFAADKNTVVWNVLGGLRLELAKQMNLIDNSKFNFLWITEFPLLSGARKKTVTWQCTILLPCRWKRICICWRLIRARCVQRPMISCSTVRSWAAEASGFLTTGFRRGCLKPLDLQRKALMNVSVSCLMLSNTECRHMQDWLMAWTVLSCCLPVRTASAR